MNSHERCHIEFSGVDVVHSLTLEFKMHDVRSLVMDDLASKNWRFQERYSDFGHVRKSTIYVLIIQLAVHLHLDTVKVEINRAVRAPYREGTPASWVT